MFERFAENKLRYEKGQVFPFLIAIIAVVIILIMITVNLGQIGIFKTDVSNAADAAALAAASVLSGALLGFGLKSDMMCGDFYITTAAIIIGCLTGIGVIIAIATGIAFFVRQICNYTKALWDAEMAFSNAKKTALQYAFNNVGVDEPRPTFKQFLIAIGEDPGNPSNVAQLYEGYLKGESTDARAYARSGFSKFMDDSKNGFWDESEFAIIEPGGDAPARIIHGYGWSQLEDGTFINSYEDGGGYDSYDNFVRVDIIGSKTYGLGLYNPVSEVCDAIDEYIQNHLNLPDWLWFVESIIEGILSFFLSLASWIFSNLLPAGLTLDNSSIEQSRILVTVERYKRPENLGLWNFRYGTVKATAQAHPFAENGDETIEPVTDLINILLNFVTSWEWDWFDTEKHLYEVELTDAF